MGLGFKKTEFLGHHKGTQTFKITNLISKVEEGCFNTVVKEAAAIFYVASNLWVINHTPLRLNCKLALIPGPLASEPWWT